MKAVEVNHLYKSYADVTAVHDLTFCVDPGEILGLIGPNGAGKSSTIKIILDFMKPDSGEAVSYTHLRAHETAYTISDGVLWL